VVDGNPGFTSEALDAIKLKCEEAMMYLLI